MPQLVLDLVGDFFDEARLRPDMVHTMLPWDFRSFFDELSLQLADAVMQHRGIPDSARRLLVELHRHGATLAAITPWGVCTPVARVRGVHQGSCSAPLLSRFGAELVVCILDAHCKPAMVGGSHCVSNASWTTEMRSPQGRTAAT